MPELPPRRLPWMAASLAVSLPVCLMLVYLLPLPRESSASGIVSFATVTGHGTRGNLFVELLCLALIAGCGILAERAGPRLEPALRRLALRLNPAPLGWTLAAVLAFAFVVNASWESPARLLADTFHEGEYLGYARTFASSARPFRDALLIHGFGVDVLPSLLAHHFLPGSVIAATRTFRMAEIALSWVGFLWLVQEVVSVHRPRRGLWIVRAAGTAILCLLYARGFAIWAQPRCAVSFAQAAALFWALRRLREGKGAGAIAFAVAASLPLGLLYNYAETAAVALVAAVAAALAVSGGRGRPVLAAAAAGATLGVLLLLALVGLDGVHDIFGQLRFWAANGADIWALPLRENDPRGLEYFLVIVAAQGLVGLALWRDRGRGFLQRNGDLLLLVALSLGTMKTWVDRADWPLLKVGSVPAALLLFALILRGLTRAAAPGEALPRWPGAAWTALASAAFLLLGNRAEVFDAVWAVHRLGQLPQLARTPDRAVLQPPLRDGVLAVRADAAGSDCFYTLTSEAVWYHLLDLPSCSRFHEAAFARTPAAQAEVVEALRTRRPKIVLVSSDSFARCFDEVCPGNALADVYRFVLENYRPWRRVGASWFWQERGPLARTGTQGGAGTVQQLPGIAPGTVRLSGTAPGSIVYVSQGREGRLLEVGMVADGKFSIDAPVAFLKDEERAFALWTYDDAADALAPLERDGKPLIARIAAAATSR